MSDWMQSDDVRKTVVVQSLQSRRDALRGAASQCRKAYTKDYMNVPMNFLADAYDQAAAVLDAALKTANRTQHDEPSEIAIQHDRSDWRD